MFVSSFPRVFDTPPQFDEASPLPMSLLFCYFGGCCCYCVADYRPSVKKIIVVRSRSLMLGFEMHLQISDMMSMMMVLRFPNQSFFPGGWDFSLLVGKFPSLDGKFPSSRIHYRS